MLGSIHVLQIMETKPYMLKLNFLYKVRKKVMKQYSFTEGGKPSFVYTPVRKKIILTTKLCSLETVYFYRLPSVNEAMEAQIGKVARSGTVGVMEFY